MFVICLECAQACKQAAFGLCRSCYTRRSREANPEKYAAYKRNYRAKNGDRLRELDRAAYHRPALNEKRRANRERIAAYHRTYNATWRDYIKSVATSWRKANLGRCEAKQARRRLRESRFFHALSQEHKDAITAFYEACPKGFEVDHILPLAGKDITGLHVLWNLQYLPRLENRRKSNKFVHDQSKPILPSGA